MAAGSGRTEPPFEAYGSKRDMAGGKSTLSVRLFSPVRDLERLGEGRREGEVEAMRAQKGLASKGWLELPLAPAGASTSRRGRSPFCFAAAAGRRAYDSPDTRTSNGHSAGRPTIRLTVA
jgi:hypothetical protein